MQKVWVGMKFASSSLSILVGAKGVTMLRWHVMGQGARLQLLFACWAVHLLVFCFLGTLASASRATFVSWGGHTLAKVGGVANDGLSFSGFIARPGWANGWQQEQCLLATLCCHSWKGIHRGQWHPWPRQMLWPMPLSLA